jgi:elongation of very long chain fatty acids protein 4
LHHSLSRFAKTQQNYTFLPCEPFNATNPPIAPLLWLFYVSKVFDFADTVFIILGKKWNQLSFLHVYHHVTIFLVYWLNLNAGYDGDIFLTVILNGAIHTVMYTYYFLSMHTKDIWWKKYLTLFQIIQFLTMNAQAVYLLCVDCKGFSPQITKLYLGYILSLLVLFLNFYFKSYSGVKPNGKKPASKRA